MGCSALDVPDNVAGDCTEDTLLFVSLARASGVPAREAGGVMFADLGKPFFARHAWAEVLKSLETRGNNAERFAWNMRPMGLTAQLVGAPVDENVRSV